MTERERVEAMRRDFVSNVSHELKTPLGALSVLAEVLADADDAVTRKRLAGRVQDEAGRMSDLVRDLLDLSRVESEEPDTAPVEVGWVVEEAVQPGRGPRRRLGSERCAPTCRRTPSSWSPTGPSWSPPSPT